jgi:hypothetical protein
MDNTLNFGTSLIGPNSTESLFVQSRRHHGRQPGMTVPRRVLPNRTYLITRRCSERRYFLRPDPQVTWIFEYLLALACERHGVELHGFVCMSNHYPTARISGSIR